MPEEYGDLNHVVPENTDPATVPQALKDYDDSLTAELLAFPPGQLVKQTAGSLLIANASGVITGTAMSGDLTISDGGVATIGTGKVTAGKLGSKAVETAKLNDSAVTAGKLGTSAVETAKLNDGAVTEDKTADGAITSRKLKPTAGAVVSSEDKTLSESYADIPGTSRTITLAVKSLVIISADFLLRLEPLGGHTIVQGFGRINIGGADVGQTAEARHDPDHENDVAQFAASARLQVELAAGEHTIKLRSKHNGGGDQGVAKAAGTGYDYVAYAV